MLDMEATLAELKALEEMKYDMDANAQAMAEKPGFCKSCGNAVIAKSECERCAAGVSSWKPGDSRKFGDGMGGPGIGRGAVAQKEEGDVAFEKKRIKGDLTAGKIIARMKVDGDQSVGEITTSYEDLRLEYSQKAEDTIRNEVMPLEHKALIRNYFDAIKRGKDASDDHDHDHDAATESPAEASATQ
jgi:hypothetical protein